MCQYIYNVQICWFVIEGFYGFQGGDDEDNGVYYDEGYRQVGDYVFQVEVFVGQFFYQGQYIVIDQIYVYQDQDIGNDQGQFEYLQDRE